MFAVLLIDDNKRFNDTLARSIKQHVNNTTVLTAVNGRVGYEILKSAKIDLIITDMQMSVMDGYDLIGYRNVHCPEVPIVVMTADTGPDMLNKLKAQGVSMCLEKPCECKTVADLAINLLLKARKTRLNNVPTPKNLPV